MTTTTALLALLAFAGACHAQGRDFPGETWETTTPEQVNMDAGTLLALAEHVRGRGCVIRHGTMVYSWGDVSKRGDVASAAKPLYSHFILKAIEDGKIAGLDTPVSDHEPRLRGKDARITWRHMAHQTSCYGVADEPGSAFDYNDWHMALLWDTLFLKVYGSSLERVDEEVLGPLLAEALQCEDDPTLLAFGTGDRAGRVGVSPRDFARFGLLYLREGDWQGRQLLSREHARMAVRSPLPNSIPRSEGVEAAMINGQRSIGSRNIPDNQCDHMGSYSFLWWTNGVDREGRRHWPSAPHDAYGAFGHGGPRAMVVIPSLDAIVSWNDADIKSREAEDRALGLLTQACLDRPAADGHVIPHVVRPQWLERAGRGPLFMCGPGDPEDFLYRGALNADGTRDGDQLALIRKVAATGANCLYVQAVRSHGGDGDETHNPFVNNDPANGVNARVLDQWNAWLDATDEADIVVLFFIYDDSARIWDTGDEVGRDERRFLRSIVAGLHRHRNLVWCIAEEYQERYSAARVRNIAAAIREDDWYGHPIAVHKLDGLDFSEFAHDPNVDQFAIQHNVDTARQLHEGMTQAWADARGGYGLNMSECADMGTGSELRQKLWATAMGGAYAMVLEMDIESTPEEDLYACGRLVRFMEASNFVETAPRDDLAFGDTEYVLANPGEEYIAYSSRAETGLGLREVPEGAYSFLWLDCATGRQVWRHSLRLTEGPQTWPLPEALGPEVALRIRRAE